MTDQHTPPAAGPGAPASRQRHTWTPPRLIQLRAGDAELGANGIKPEQTFAYGS